MTPSELPTAWRARAAELRRWAAAEGAACALEGVADELDAALRRERDECLTLTAASKVCGYTPDHLGRLIRGGAITNMGRENAPRIRRGDLPMKAGGRVASLAVSAYDPGADARFLRSRRGG